MSERKFVAGVDSSTQSCKVVILDPATGEIVREGRAPHPDGTEVHPDYWWDAFLEAVDQAGGLDDVRALSVAGQQHGMVLLDADGEVIREALLWNDTRSADAAEHLILELGEGNKDQGVRRWVEKTGSAPVASLTATKLRWVADNEPENAGRIAAVCLPHDWLTWKISGSADIHTLTTDRSDASGTAYMSRLEPEYLYDLLALALRVDEDEARKITLPKILGPWDVASTGDSTRGWDEIALGPGLGDNAGAALGLELKPGEASLSLGTSGVVAVISDHSIADPMGLVTGFADATGNWLPLACTLNASRIIDAMARVIDADYGEFDELALSVPDAAGLTLVPYFEGERTPNLPDATAALEGMTLANSDRAHVARATVEGLLGLMRFALDSVRELGVEIETVYMIGGGAKSAAVQELAPSMLDANVVLAKPAEYVALGAARQAAGLGLE
ncbi:FGGY family carbohydrate kinase [Actinomycetaceae bacterium MB13-C1-2]|nr:FGGY family carbohydrate kinase [Actinomycetaceae bacterium MB13-C1-2]